MRATEDVSKENEEAMNWDAYNFTVLARALHEYEIVPEFVNYVGRAS